MKGLSNVSTVHTNRLAQETSRYLQQHAHNPVDWYPWGDEAFEEAQRRQVPVFLSIGYSTCHWCHVMAHESFNDPDVASYLNEHFVCIKVDREERPDVDAIYMRAVQAMGVRGGWPLSVFLTPDRQPFYGGTYYPPEERRGMPSFRRVLESVVQAWRERQQEIVEGASALAGQLGASELSSGGGTPMGLLLQQSAERIAEEFDARYGGFGQQPKFPQPMLLEYLLHMWANTKEQRWLDMVERTLQRMARGGIYDQVGGGFHRYATDQEWLVPHFEKMLYDNAQLAVVYLHTFQATGDVFYQKICQETLEYLLREMRLDNGGFASAQDADTEGEEGKYYLWTYEEIEEALDDTEDVRIVAHYYDVSIGGNFEGRNILHTTKDLDVIAALAHVSEEAVLAAVERARPLLLAARQRRLSPGRDDKVITSWNALVLQAFAEAAAVLDSTRYLTAARDVAKLLTTALRPHGRLQHVLSGEVARIPAFLDDFANLSFGLMLLYQATFEREWLTLATDLAEEALERFSDEEQIGFYDTVSEHRSPLRRSRELTDNAIPAGTSVFIDTLLHLAALQRHPEWEERVGAVFARLMPLVGQYPGAFGRLLCTLDFYLRAPKEIAIVGDPGEETTRALLRVVRKCYLPNYVLACGNPDRSDGPGLLEGRPMVRGAPAAYVCEHCVCLAPVTLPEELAELLTASKSNVWREA